MKSWKKALRKEFDESAPALRDDVRCAPVITQTPSACPTPRNENIPRIRRVRIGSALAAAVIVVAFTCTGIFGLFRPPAVPENESLVFALEINPAVAFITDAHGVVQSIRALNEDADVILSDESTLSRMRNQPISEAVIAYTDSALKLGYLDWNAPHNAVRLTGSTQTHGKLTAAVSERLKNYFMANGMYAIVVENTADVKELCDRWGIEKTENLSDLIRSLEVLSECFGERVDRNADAEMLRNLYKTYIMGGQTLELVRDELLANLQSIIKNAQMLRQISMHCLEIMTHRDNPFYPLPADYWRIKQYPNADYTTSFAQLMEETEELLNRYEKQFGTAITGTEELRAAAQVYASLPGVNFEEVFCTLTLAEFQESAQQYVSILHNIGCDVSALESLLIVPETAQEYIRQFRTISLQLFQSRREQYKQEYEQPRSEISPAEYGEFLNKITKEYGSLENFWNQK